MADQVGAYFDNGQPAYWIEASSGKPYHLVNGKKSYLPPRSINPYGPSGAQTGSFLHGAGEFNPQTGNFDQHLAGGNILSAVVGAGLGLGGLSAAGAFGGAAAGGAGAAPALSAPAALETGGLAGDLGGIGVPASLAAPAAGGVGAVGVPAALAAPTSLETGGMAGNLGNIGVPAGLSNTGLAPVAAGSNVLPNLIKAAIPATLAAKNLLSPPSAVAGGTSALPPEMQAILAEFARRVTNQGPLADATTAQALAGLPRTK